MYNPKIYVCMDIKNFKRNIIFQYLHREATNHTYDFSERIFMVRYPFPINTMAAYLSVLFEEQWVLFGSALGWICCDALFAQLTSHVCLQLQVCLYRVYVVLFRCNSLGLHAQENDNVKILPIFHIIPICI